MSTISDPYAAGQAKDPTYQEVRALPDGDLLARYAIGVENLDRRVFRLTDDQLDLAFLPEANVGRWPARVLLGHLADAEVLYVHRMRRTIGEDRPMLSVWDEDAAIDAGLYHGPSKPIGAFVAVIHTLRKWTAEWLGTLTAGQLAREAMHPQRGPLSVRRMAQECTWHLEHHARYLNRKLDRLLGPESTPCGPSCGCRG